MDALGIAVGVVLIAILLIAGVNMPDYFRLEHVQIFYIVVAVLAASVAIIVFREADL
jgi:hypothetical protein